MVSRTQLTATKAIQRRTGRTFHAATRLLPKRVRHPTYVLYAFFRKADEVVDDPDAGPPAQQRMKLDRMEAAAMGERETDDAILSAFQEVKSAHEIPDAEVTAFFEAMRADIDTTTYATHEELAEYLRGSAVAVGQMMTAVMGPADPGAAQPHATALAQAFQLTNFLRDVREDVLQYGRVYVPRASLQSVGLDIEAVERLEPVPALRSVIRSELNRIERLYEIGVAGIDYLPSDCQFAVLLSAVLYADHHRLIRERDFDVVTQTPTLTSRRRAWLLLRTWLHWRRCQDPLETFSAVSAVDVGTEREIATRADQWKSGLPPRSVCDVTGYRFDTPAQWLRNETGDCRTPRNGSRSREAEVSADSTLGETSDTNVLAPCRLIERPTQRLVSTARTVAGTVRNSW